MKKVLCMLTLALCACSSGQPKSGLDSSPDGAMNGGGGGKDDSNHSSGNGSVDLGASDGSNNSGGGSGSDGSTSGGGGGTTTPPAGPTAPAVSRGAAYFGTPEKFNRYYTDPSYTSQKTIYVSPSGGGDGASAASPTSVSSAFSQVTPGTRVYFTKGSYAGCYELDGGKSGTYDAPVVLYGERNTDGSRAVTINCCASGRQTCINLETADYVAVDGFELVGGRYGVRTVGGGYAAKDHQMGVAILRSEGHDQDNDPFFSGQSDWMVVERNIAHDVGTGDGHGIYLSNGSDWNIVRYNETYNTANADFQINADPISTCQNEGVAYSSPECDAVAGTSTTGGRGASDFFLVEGNFFHHSKGQGANFTSTRSSIIRNNIFALSARHGVSFWQESDNPKLGARDNTVVQNLFVGSVAGRQALMLIASSTGNTFANNLFVGVSLGSGQVGANASVPLMSSDASTTNANTFSHNGWISGSFTTEDGSASYVPKAGELRSTAFQSSWFKSFPTSVKHEPTDFQAAAGAPWADAAPRLDSAQLDLVGSMRPAMTTLGPIQEP